MNDSLRNLEKENFQMKKLFEKPSTEKDILHNEIEQLEEKVKKFSAKIALLNKKDKKSFQISTQTETCSKHKSIQTEPGKSVQN